MRPARLATAVVVALLVLAPTAAAAKPPTGVFVGKAGKVAFGVALDSRGVVAYACDGRRLGAWFKGRVGRRSSLSLRTGSRRLRLTATTSRRGTASATVLRARFAGRTATLRRARGRQGLYRSENRVGGRKRLGGWIVLPGGRQVGVLATGTAVSTAPTLSTTSLTAGSLIAGTVIAPSEVGPLVVDLGGDGLNITGTATTSLLGGGARSVKWTAPGDDDAFIAFDTAKLQAAGFSVSPSGRVLARGGLQITRGGVTTTTVDGFHAVRLLDSNRDGFLSVADTVWQAVLAYRDLNGSGAMDAGEADSAQQVLDSLNTQSTMDQLSATLIARSTAATRVHNALLAIIRNGAPR